jgi:hypothetical protein
MLCRPGFCSIDSWSFVHSEHVLNGKVARTYWSMGGMLSQALRLGVACKAMKELPAVG